MRASRVVKGACVRASLVSRVKGVCVRVVLKGRALLCVCRHNKMMMHDDCVSLEEIASAVIKGRALLTYYVSVDITR